MVQTVRYNNVIKKHVYVVSGQYEANGRISNVWTYRIIKKNGKLSKKTHSCYGYELDPPKVKYEIQTKVKLSL